ncbi:crotonase/enoyl-CoA hydratase family protein [Nocardioides humilatus]|uniref:Crotonase/enoyl-CoA hydratase family protein n=1 Tax=Nocardioides humilatus TaxID=2607660 RepID=A0A5B1L858_9ACTN|nr:crotonase/enoyl-CoA hydratase family protein [Nocardioides humilatus]KAA1416901.1 crotonase/enoyl-CoA hydratase family protein [Nocardioides humilatus]
MTYDERPVADAVAGHDRQVRAQVLVAADPDRVRALLGDLGQLPAWMEMHAGWRGTPPAAAVEGLTFVEQVKIMGIPAEVAWTVDRADAEGITITGEGPMGIVLVMSFALDPAEGGTAVTLDCGLSGDPVRGPMGGSVSTSIGEALEASLAALARLATTEVDASARAAAGIVHHASGAVLDPRTPVIVGAGQVVQRVPDPTKDPVELAVEALRAAEADAGGAGLLSGADAVYAVATTSWTYRDQAALVAERVGAQPQETIQSARFGGDAGQALINAAGQAIADGDASVVLVCGAEAGATLAAAQKSGIEVTWPQQAADVTPTRVLGSEREANNQAEADAGLGAPVYTYGLIESALRARSGASIAEHQATITELWAGLSQIAADNPYAWQPTAMTAEELADTGDSNRLVSAPYSKLLCANLQVDLASGLIMTSAAAAEAAGVPQEKWVFLHAGAAAYDEWFVSERGDLTASPAIRAIGKAALAEAGLQIDQVKHVDLYSCFPSAVQIAAHELGLPVGDPARPLSVTGGLTFAGGPGNNYGGHAVATLVQRLRDDPDSYGLSTSLGWYLTKHALGIYSATPPAHPYRALAPVVPPEPTRRALVGYQGPATIEAATVQYDRDGQPVAAIVSGVTPDGARALVRTKDASVAVELASADPIGWQVTVAGSDVTIEDRDRHEVPPCPEPTVLVEDRGQVRVITLNRPARRNAIDLATAQLLEKVIDAFEDDDSVRVAVLTGAGGTFCAGMDLKAAAMGEFAITERRGPLGIAAQPISKPVIAAVEGHALAGGCELALVADLIVASSDSQFGIPEVKRGLVAAAGGVLRLSQRLPRNVAVELALTGDPMPAARMAELGLVNRIAEPGKVLDAALDLAQQIVINAPISVAVSREIIEQAPGWSREEEFQRQLDLATRAVLSEDATEGVVAFAEHRQPVWKGR